MVKKLDAIKVYEIAESGNTLRLSVHNRGIVRLNFVLIGYKLSYVVNATYFKLIVYKVT